LYATGNAHETRYVEYTENDQPVVYFDKKDIPAMRSRKTYLTVFDADNFKKLPTGEWFSKNPGTPIKQTPIGDPFKYIASQGWIVRVTDDLDKVFDQVKKMHKAGKIAQYGAEGMNESQQGVAEMTAQNFVDGEFDESTGDRPLDPAPGRDFVFNKYLVKITPTAIEIYHGGDLVLSKPGDFSNPTRQDMYNARRYTTDLFNRAQKKKELARLAGKDLEEMTAQNFVGGMTASYQERENQPVDEDYIDEKWSQKYKSSINCANPRGFSQRAHCAGRKK
jgi:hypothetical protein